MIDRAPQSPNDTLASLHSGRAYFGQNVFVRLVQRARILPGLGSIARTGSSKGGPTGSAVRLGVRGERAAEKYLKKHGMRVLARNVRTFRGEADLVCRDTNGCYVVVEVKSRQLPREDRSRRGRPENALTVFKQRKLLQVADDLVRANNWRDVPIRIDLVAIDFQPGARPQVCAIRHYQRAVKRS